MTYHFSSKHMINNRPSPNGGGLFSQKNTDMDFSKLNGFVKSKELNEGEQHLYRFPNGLGASVVKSPFSYGGDQGLYELAVIEYNDEGGFSLTYETNVTDDVIGYLTYDDVKGLLEEIKEQQPFREDEL